VLAAYTRPYVRYPPPVVAFRAYNTGARSPARGAHQRDRRVRRRPRAACGIAKAALNDEPCGIVLFLVGIPELHGIPRGMISQAALLIEIAASHGDFLGITRGQ
jgi:hypothetical protein